MDLALDDEQRALQQVLRAFLADKSPESAVRRQLDDPRAYDRGLWSQLSLQLALPALAVPEAYGGSGFGFVELGVVLEELGRALSVVPFLASCVMASQLLLHCDDEQAKQDLLPGLASGEVVGTVAMSGPAGSWEPDRVAATARVAAGAWSVTGTTSYVLDGAVADLVLVVARADGRLVVLAVAGDAPGLVAEPVTTLDLTRKQATLIFTDAPARLVAEGAAARTAVDAMLDRTAIALAAEALGGTDAALRMAVDYAKVREQFGRQIGSFQAVKHSCATMLVDLEASRSAVYYALWAASVGSAETPAVASLAKAFCTDAFLAAASENVQLHGGIGFTWEHPAHLYLKRAKSAQLFLGDATFHRLQLADRIGL